MHYETARGSAVPGRCSSHPSVANSTADSTEQGESTEQGGGLEQGGDMCAMLRNAFGVHNVSEAVSSQSQAVNEGTFGGDALKYYE
jgi:hypothetical protein